MAIAVDFDGTLVEYNGFKGIEHIGEPIQPMMDRVHKWIAEGKEVCIFTARVSEGGDDAARAEHYIRAFLMKHGLGHLDVTATKHKKFQEFWDDRAVQVEHNTGLTIIEIIQREYP